MEVRKGDEVFGQQYIIQNIDENIPIEHMKPKRRQACSIEGQMYS